MHSAPGRLARECGPHIELAEHECGGSKRLECRTRIRGRVEWQHVAEIDVERLREALGAWREVGVRQLRIGQPRSRQLEHRSRLKAFADTGRVHPEQGTTGPARERGEAVTHAASHGECS
jgi:hypothetical protein